MQICVYFCKTRQNKRIKGDRSVDSAESKRQSLVSPTEDSFARLHSDSRDSSCFAARRSTAPAMKTSTLVLLGLVAATLIVDPISSLRCRVYRNNKGIVERKEGEKECKPKELCSSFRFIGVAQHVSDNDCIPLEGCPVLNKMTTDRFNQMTTYCCETDLCNPILPLPTKPPGPGRRWRRNAKAV
ncbi:hypothetical protein QR680_011057 [Steinernema hermaphroditum]|uniref:Activin types I and II receptor domain-containing protein n=1 Tax=Steinernema hermaphroditum TaxID=289476 RepID=A0AA39IQY4_9BILA|nr:hypothetical protein QR680_011057 [Steinernema hermaphroditum]